MTGFVIEAGVVVCCAPILHKKFRYWETMRGFIPTLANQCVIPSPGHTEPNEC